MYEKISFNLTVKSSVHDEQNILENFAKTQSVSDKNKKVREEDNFNTMIQDRMAEERNKANLKKKGKRQEDVQGIFIPIFSYQTPVISDHYLIRLKNSKKKRCSKCGELFEPENKESPKAKSNTYICKSCMNIDIESFLRENYL